MHVWPQTSMRNCPQNECGQFWSLGSKSLLSCQKRLSSSRSSHLLDSFDCFHGNPLCYNSQSMLEDMVIADHPGYSTGPHYPRGSRTPQCSVTSIFLVMQVIHNQLKPTTFLPEICPLYVTCVFRVSSRTSNGQLTVLDHLGVLSKQAIVTSL